MSMFGNMMSAGQDIQSLFSAGKPDSFNGQVPDSQKQILDALMMQNLESYKGGPQQGPMMGMPGKPVVDQMSPPPANANAPITAPDTKGIIPGIMSMFTGGLMG